MHEETNDNMDTINQIDNKLFQFNAYSIGTDISEYEQLKYQANNVDDTPIVGEVSQDPTYCCDSFMAFSQPTSDYINSTTKINISNLSNFTNYNSITDGNETVTFNTSVNKRSVPLGGWLTWGAPPYTESSTPAVLYSNGAKTLTLNLSKYASIFGFELEPNPLIGSYTFKVQYYSDSTLISSITRTVAGAFGARLFAAQTDGSLLFNRVVITGTTDFAIAQIRYSTVIGQCCGNEPQLVTFESCQTYESLPIVKNVMCSGRLLTVDVTVTACQRKTITVGVLICDPESNALRFKTLEKCMPDSTDENVSCVENTFTFCFVFDSAICDPLSLLVKVFADYSCFDFSCNE